MKLKKVIGLSLGTVALGGTVGIAVVACGSSSSTATETKTAAPHANRTDQGTYQQGGTAPTDDPGEQQEGYKPWTGPVFRTENGVTLLTSAQIAGLSVGAKFQAVYTAEVADGYTGSAYTYTKTYTVVAASVNIPTPTTETGTASVAFNAELTVPASKTGYEAPILTSTNYVKGETAPGAASVTATWKFNPTNAQTDPIVTLNQTITVNKGVWPAATFDEENYPNETGYGLTVYGSWDVFDAGTLPTLPAPAEGYKWTSVTYRSTNYAQGNAPLLGIAKGSTTLPVPTGITPKAPDGYEAFSGPQYVVSFVSTAKSANRTDEELALRQTAPTAGADGTLAKLSAGAGTGATGGTIADSTGSKITVYYTSKPSNGAGRDFVLAFQYRIVTAGNEKAGPTGNAALQKNLTEDEVKALVENDGVSVILVATPDTDKYETTETATFTYVVYARAGAPPAASN